MEGLFLIEEGCLIMMVEFLVGEVEVMDVYVGVFFFLIFLESGGGDMIIFVWSFILV